MNAASDQQLLRAYAEQRDEAAFRELVQRHTDLVYSAALRQVESDAAARDLTQGVFTDLARRSPDILGKQTSESLAGWLHRATRYAALNHLRDTRRRRDNERQAMEQLLTNSDAPADWGQIRPALDEALDSLDDTDREALLLRYFKNQDFRTVGQQLGVSDDAAQKRVSRAVERLREFFAKRGVTVGAGGLVVAISANAVQAAPVGLAVTISAAALAGTAATTSTIIAATTKTIAMTTLQKTLVTVTVAVLAGAGIYEARQAAQLREQVQTLQQSQAPLLEQIQQLQNNFTDATNRLADLLAENSRFETSPERNELLRLRREVTRLRNESSDPAGQLAMNWLKNVELLKQRFELMPQGKIPEFQLLTDKDWLNAASTKLQTEVDFRRAMASLRGSAEQNFASKLRGALKDFLTANNGSAPTDLSQLQPYFTQAIDDAILQRWKIVNGKSAPVKMNGADLVVTQKAPVDDVFDNRFSVTANGVGSSQFFFSDNQTILAPLYDAFDAAYPNHSSGAPSANDLLPFVKTPEQQTALQKLILRESANSD